MAGAHYNTTPTATTEAPRWPHLVRAAIAQIFGALGTIFYGALIGTGSNRAGLTIGYLIGDGVMIVGGLAGVFLGINAEGKPLEQVARPLTEVRAERS